MWEEKYICHQCVGDAYVRQHIKKIGSSNQTCSYCKRKRINIHVEHILAMVHDVFEYYFEAYEDIYDCGRGDSAQEVIYKELSVEFEVAEDIYNLLAEKFNPHNDFDGVRYNDAFVYRHITYSTGKLSSSWRRATDSLLNETRYFNREANAVLDSLFRDINKLKTLDSSSPVKMLTEEIRLYRARVFENQEEVKQALEQPEKYFGPPPPSLARSGRMNAQGISVFYGATSVDVAIAEVRPPVGSIVVTAPFVPLRALRVLDISALDSLSFGSGSKFDPQTRKTNERAVFFRTLSRKLTLPTFGKRKDSDYLITQLVADFLSDRETFGLDGVSFKSTQVQAGTGCNIVLFNKSSAVRHAADESRRFNVELYEYAEDNPYNFGPEIQLIVGVPQKKHYVGSRAFARIPEPTLRLITDGMTYHNITGVTFITSQAPVNQGEDLIQPMPPEPFDDLSDF